MAMINRFTIRYRSEKGRLHKIKLNDKIGAEILFLSIAKEKKKSIELIDEQTKEIRVRDY